VTLQLRTSVKYLKGVGPKRAEALARLGIRSVVGPVDTTRGRRYNRPTTLRIPSRASASARFGPTPFRYFTDVLSWSVTRR